MIYSGASIFRLSANGACPLRHSIRPVTFVMFVTFNIIVTLVLASVNLTIPLELVENNKVFMLPLC
jgi:hypothetical protein